MRVLSLILIIGGICWGSLSGIAAERSSVPNSRALYHEMALAGTIDYAVFERAIAGYNRMGGHDKDILTVIDFTKPSTEKRLFVIDLKLKKILFISYVAHGRNSGEICHVIFQPGRLFQEFVGFLQNGKHVLREERVFFGVGRFGAGN